MDAGHVLPVHLRCEYRDNPVGLGEVKPRLSWIADCTDPSARGAAQSAWQVQVTSASGSFENPTHWDSGIIRSSQCNQIVYDGKELQSGEPCVWRVRLWDEKDRPSAWSEPASWRMGLLAADDWKAQWIEAPAAMQFNACKWIWHPDEETPQDGAKAGMVVFKRRLTVPAGAHVVTARALIAVDDAFQLYVNGTLAGESTEKIDSHRARTVIEMGDCLRQGENIIALVATNHADGSPAGATGKIAVRLDNQKQLLLTLDDGWVAGRDDKNLATWDEKWPKARAIHGVGVTDPICRPITPWGVPGREDGLALPPVGLFRREFELQEVPQEVVLHASALGLYEVWINGFRVGDDAFTPGWSDYTKRVYANSYEVAHLLSRGRNVITVMLADGWYCGYVGWSRRRDHYGVAPKLMLQLNAGEEVLVKSDASWQVTTDGPITEADLLMGEEHDARRELAGWTEPGWGDDAMDPVIVSDPPGVPVECYPGDPVRATEEIRPIAVSEPRRGVFVFDMGQNFTGVARIKATGPAGTVVTLRFAEVLTDCGELYTEALRGARCRDRYIKATDDVEVWQPRFTFHGFRFVEVEGLAAAPDLDTVTGVVLHTAMERAGEIRTASEMVNKLAENIRWGQRGNFLEAPTDCPQRDERLGWTGDAQIFIRTATFNYDVAAFFTKWLRDLFDAQRPDGWFCMVAPAINPWPNPDAGFAAWTDASIICPWTMYHVYGDTRIVERYWDQMVAQMDYIERTSKHLIRPNEGFGDWVSLNADTPKDLLGTAYFAYDAMLMADMARGVGREVEAKRYEKLYEDIRAAFQKEFIEPDGGLRGRTQCNYVLALRFNLLPENLRQTAAAFLAQDLAYRGGHFSTGFVGLKDLMPTLSDVGRHDLACRILLNEDFPSWGYQIRAGATTTWERWDGWTEELGLQTPTMNSFNHYAFGAVGEWMFTHLAGIDLSEVAYRRVRIRPHPDARLRHVRARYRSAAGWVTTEWLLDVRGRKLTVRCRVPVGAQALIELPVKHADGVLESGRALSQSPGVTLQVADNKCVCVEVSSGHYEFTMPWG